MADTTPSAEEGLTHTATVEFEGRSYVFNTHGPGDRIGSRLAARAKFHELRTLKAVRRLGLGGIYFDIGGHIGNHSVFFGNECRCERLYTFEFNPASIELLRANLRANVALPWHIVTELLGRRGESYDAGYIDEGNTGSFRIKPGSTHKAAALDDLFPDLTGLSFMKLDIEGGELAALEGGAELIERNRPVITTECGHEHEAEAIGEFLKQFGYRRGKSYNAPPNIFWHPPGRIRRLLGG